MKKPIENLIEKIENNTILQMIAALGMLAYFVCKWAFQLITEPFRKDQK